MSKAPVAGKVKTRLIPRLGSRRAASVYRQLLEKTVSSLASLKAVDVELWCTPSINHPFFLQMKHQYGCYCHAQPAGDLGKKMAGIFSRQLQKYHNVIIIGADSPVIDHQVIQRCQTLLASDRDIVLGAADDGGYALIAMKKLEAELFRDIPWGTSRVMHLTLQRAKRLKLKVGVIPWLWDVDTAKDYRRWQQMKQEETSDSAAKEVYSSTCYGNDCAP